MSTIEFSDEEKNILVKKIKLYFEQELDQDIAQFDALFLMDFIAEEMGAYFYNRGVQDAKLILEEKIEAIGDAFYEIEKPTYFSK
ncbi:DUF2164 domain-containing protein [Oceanicoccus sagamiensis]|uniref:DUF2164 domain-containing protein n=1 Tax=Oceanicoccus sagamiensis TaxID=716816 RepID=A0A1X9NE08_9GAMM|nr:DUF2164 domain-containing protein [Oceanicoccus sagamiensis]ARN74125.1 hypothetical protein BST96_08315 [Oceanicoccus sagamiensis]